MKAASCPDSLNADGDSNNDGLAMTADIVCDGSRSDAIELRSELFLRKHQSNWVNENSTDMIVEPTAKASAAPSNRINCS